MLAFMLNYELVSNWITYTYAEQAVIKLIYLLKPRLKLENKEIRETKASTVKTHRRASTTFKP